MLVYIVVDAFAVFDICERRFFEGIQYQLCLKTGSQYSRDGTVEVILCFWLPDHADTQFAFLYQIITDFVLE